MVESSTPAPRGGVPLGSAIEALRAELLTAWRTGHDQGLHFKPSPIELTLQVGVTTTGSGSAGIKWWLIELGGQLSHESTAAQTVKLTLEPIMFDHQGRPTEILIDTPDPDEGDGGDRADARPAPREVSLGAAD